MYVPPSSRFQGVDGEILSLSYPLETPTLIFDLDVKGAFFGTTFPHLLFQTYPVAFSLPPPAPAPAPASVSNKEVREPTNPLTSLSKVYVPRIYGFKVSERARSGPRMQWLRMRVSCSLFSRRSAYSFPSFRFVR
ncbi:hypothetical protein BCR35DRAFT_305674 [Leucosporidium creatinivorum]|uniref:Uncharacterized protein n=1 Tax=Leucosporidium creatinivorum TaxID=106004 RepID=A0A1Y2EZB2_9BASI|nr:hypothetical protein BCR35DRAFT_305674 [Leucosporidium creatinivorum]